MSIGLYGAFLAMQTRRYRGYFVLADGPAVVEDHHEADGSAWGHAVLLAAYMAPVVFLAEQLARPMDYAIETLHAPTVLGGLVIALVVATPEGFGAARAALANDVQRAVNIFLGSVLCTIGLTVPAMLIISHITGRGLTLGLEHTDFIMLLLTLAVSVVTFASGRTNVMQGAVHLLLFVAYLLLMFEG
jgi:Ca2+:H+ antiporter